MTLPDSEFAYESWDHVHKVWMRARNEDGRFLSRKKDGWYIDDTIKVSSSYMQNLENVLTHMSIQFIPPAPLAKTIITDLNQNGIEVRLYDKKNQILRDYWVGMNTNDERGTAFKMRQGNQPYIMELPLFEGTLRSLFTVTPTMIRDKKIIEVDPANIITITINYPKQTDAGFTLDVSGDKPMISKLTLSETGNTPQPTNDKSVENFLSQLNKVAFESYEKENKLRSKVNMQVPFATFDMLLKNGKSYSFKIWPVQWFIENAENEEERERILVSPRYYYEDSKGEFYIVQERLIKQLLVGYPFFLKK